MVGGAGAWRDSDCAVWFARRGTLGALGSQPPAMRQNECGLAVTVGVPAREKYINNFDEERFP